MTADAAYGHQEAIREGFPEMTGGQFVEMFCQHMQVSEIYARSITRIEFKHV